MQLTRQCLGHDISNLDRRVLVLITDYSVEQQLALEMVFTCNVLSTLVMYCRTRCYQ